MVTVGGRPMGRPPYLLYEDHRESYLLIHFHNESVEEAASEEYQKAAESLYRYLFGILTSYSLHFCTEPGYVSQLDFFITTNHIRQVSQGHSPFIGIYR